MDAFGICDPAVWVAVGHQFVKHLDGVIVGYMDKVRTPEMAENNAYYTREENDPHFSVTANTTRFITDPLRNVTTAGCEVSKGFVQECVFKKEIMSLSPHAQTNTWADELYCGIINMHEMAGSRQRVYALASVRYWFVCANELHEDDLEAMKGLSVEHTSACFGLKVPKFKAPANIRWKTGVVYAVFPEPKCGQKRK